MQTAEFRYLSKREKKYLAKPDGRHHLKAAVTMLGRLCEKPADRTDDNLKDRRCICNRLRKGKPC